MVSFFHPFRGSFSVGPTTIFWKSSFVFQYCLVLQYCCCNIRDACDLFRLLSSTFWRTIKKERWHLAEFHKKTTRSLFKKDIRELWQHFVEHLECRDIDESDMVLSLPHLIKQVQLLLTSCTTLQTLEFRYERKVTVKFLSTLVMKKKENKSVRANW